MPGSLLISSSYDAAGSLTGLATTNATFTYTANRAGHRLTETATVTGDPQNGEAQFTYDPLGRLAGYTPPGSSLIPCGWDEVPNRTSAGGVTTTFDAADRPTSTGFAADLDGRLTAIPARGGAPAKSLAYDALGRLVSATGAGVTRTYAYDPLDRLVTVSDCGNPVTRIRYAGQSSSVVQLLDGAWAVTRSVGTDWSGTPLADWAAGGSGWRRLIANGHGDLVAALAANGSVSTSLRLDPWGIPLRAVPTGYPSFGFQGSWTDRTTTLAYARARWYDPVLATFTSEDPLAGDPADPPSRHLYAYGAGDPVDRVDPGGLHWELIAERTRNVTEDEARGRRSIFVIAATAFCLVAAARGLLLRGECLAQVAGASVDTDNYFNVALANKTVVQFVKRQRIQKWQGTFTESRLRGHSTSVMWITKVGTVTIRYDILGRPVSRSAPKWPAGNSLEYLEHFYWTTWETRADTGGAVYNDRWRRCGDNRLLFGRDWGPDSIADATGRSGGYCRPYSAAIWTWDDPDHYAGVHHAATTNFPAWYEAGSYPRYPGTRWR